MKKVVLVVSFGTSYKETMKKLYNLVRIKSKII